MLCSIVLPVYNHLEYARLFVDSLVRYTDWPYELVVVDDSDGEGIGPFLGQVPEVTIRRHPSPVGLARAWNDGLRAARGDYLVVCNNDVVLSPHWLSRLVGKLKEEPEVGIACPVTNMEVDYFPAFLAEREALGRVRQCPPEWAALDLAYGDGFTAFVDRFTAKYEGLSLPNIGLELGVIRRSVVEDVGLFDESFGGFFRIDDDFAQRVLLNGRANLIRTYGNVYVHHFGNVTSSGFEVAAMQARAEAGMAEKWPGIGATLYAAYVQGKLGPTELRELRRELSSRLPFLGRP